MATLKESYVASGMENQSLKSAQKSSKGPKPRNTSGVPRMRNLDAEGFETPLNHVINEDADESEKEYGDGDDDGDVNPSKELPQGQPCRRLDDPVQQLIARQELDEEMQKRLTANQRVQEQLKMKLSKGEVKVPRASKVTFARITSRLVYLLYLTHPFLQDPSKRLKVRPPTRSAIITPRGDAERRVVDVEDVSRATREASRSKGKSTATSEAEDSLAQGEVLPLAKKRKAVETEVDLRDFTQKSTLEKANLFDSLAKRLVSRPDLTLIRGLSEEEEHLICMTVMSHRHTAGFRKLREGLKEKTRLCEEQAKEIEALSKKLEDEKVAWDDEKAALENRIKDLTSQRNSIQCKRDEIIEEWKTSKFGLEFAADMGLEASEVAAREAVDRLQAALGRCILKPAGLRLRQSITSPLMRPFTKAMRPALCLRRTMPLMLPRFWVRSPNKSGTLKPLRSPGIRRRWFQRARMTRRPRTRAPLTVRRSKRSPRLPRAIPRAALTRLMRFLLLLVTPCEAP
ncbi:hypothetical protein BVRB_4g084520 [Beta vulgaris subsp. vulgaris]|nr:hypothetical protein BVRB_4g084520 [Beta vulgaris subsp. vulgaris]